MSWHGSLTCTYCYQRGHTRRKCPEMKKRHDEYVALEKEGKTHDATWGQRGAYREWREAQEGLKESNKVCAFCGKGGHRVGTCPERMQVVQQLQEIDEWFIPIALKTIEEIGYGVGTVIKGSGYVGNTYRSEIPFMLTNSNPYNKWGVLSVINLWDSKWIHLIIYIFNI